MFTGRCWKVHGRVSALLAPLRSGRQVFQVCAGDAARNNQVAHFLKLIFALGSVDPRRVRALVCFFCCVTWSLEFVWRTHTSNGLCEPPRSHKGPVRGVEGLEQQECLRGLAFNGCLCVEGRRWTWILVGFETLPGSEERCEGLRLGLGHVTRGKPGMEMNGEK